jgi:hypothetical protein
MTPRDRLPYVDHAQRLPDGSELFNVYNLTSKDMAMMVDLLRERRARNLILLTEMDAPPHIRAEMAVEAQRLDQLNMCLQYIAHR